MVDWNAVFEQISAASGVPFSPQTTGSSIAGGCINRAQRVTDGARDFFVKTNDSAKLQMFEAELAGLAEIAATGTLRVPSPLCAGLAGNAAFLVMEYIQPGRPRRGGAALAGRQLAAMHRHTQPQFGWYRDNTIGSTPQANRQCADWPEFWAQQRLGFQLALAARNGYTGPLQRRGEKLLSEFPALLEHAPVPSLLHGDLWGGNMAFDGQGNPLIFDPAVYYGDREADLAMTELFGGFARDFYAGYREAWPLVAGYPERKVLYNLYHILNHLNLFGAGYLSQAQHMIDSLLAAVR